MRSLLLLVLAPSACFAAPDSGLADSDAVVYTLNELHSADAGDQLTRGAGVCLFADLPRAGEPARTRHGGVRMEARGSDEITPCKGISGPRHVFVPVAEFAPGDFQSAPWNGHAPEGRPPFKWTLVRTVTGGEINAAYGKLLEACRDLGCRGYRVMFVNRQMGFGWTFPVSDFARQDNALMDFARRVPGKPLSFVTDSQSITFAPRPAK